MCKLPCVFLVLDTWLERDPVTKTDNYICDVLHFIEHCVHIFNFIWVFVKLWSQFLCYFLVLVGIQKRTILFPYLGTHYWPCFHISASNIDHVSISQHSNMDHVSKPRHSILTMFPNLGIQIWTMFPNLGIQIWTMFPNPSIQIWTMFPNQGIQIWTMFPNLGIQKWTMFPNLGIQKWTMFPNLGIKLYLPGFQT